MRPEDLDIVSGCIAVHPERRGGQHVAMMCTGIRVTHKPTGISVLANDERSQHANREVAMRKLEVALAELRDAPGIETAPLLFDAEMFDLTDAGGEA